MRVAIVENTAGTQHGQVGIALAEAGAVIDQYRPFLGQPLPLDLNDIDALVVFGGEQSALADRTHPYLAPLSTLMRQTVEAGTAVLGICLGSQLLARGFGAHNHVGAAPEFGWQTITTTQHAQADPVLSAVPDGFSAFQWHSDTFDLPVGATHLAQADGAKHQAFRIGRAGYATQFHFEANRNVVAEWTRRFSTPIEAMAPGWLAQHAAQSSAHGAAADAAGLALSRAFVAQIR